MPGLNKEFAQQTKHQLSANSNICAPLWCNQAIEGYAANRRVLLQTGRQGIFRLTQRLAIFDNKMAVKNLCLYQPLEIVQNYFLRLRQACQKGL